MRFETFRALVMAGVAGTAALMATIAAGT